MHFFAQDVLKDFIENKEIRAPPVNIIISSGKAQEMPYSFADGMKAEGRLLGANDAKYRDKIDSGDSLMRYSLIFLIRSIAKGRVHAMD